MEKSKVQENGGRKDTFHNLFGLGDSVNCGSKGLKGNEDQTERADLVLRNLGKILGQTYLNIFIP